MRALSMGQAAFSNHIRKTAYAAVQDSRSGQSSIQSGANNGPGTAHVSAIFRTLTPKFE
jgi:hypothetical protein